MPPSSRQPPSPMTPSTFFNSNVPCSSSTSQTINAGNPARQVSSSTSHPSAADTKLKSLVADLQARIQAGPPGNAMHAGEATSDEVLRREYEERMRIMERELGMYSGVERRALSFRG